jgi:hypothetical protein
MGVKRPNDTVRAAHYRAQLAHHATTVRPLPGIQGNDAMNCLSWQIVDSLRRIEFVHHIRDASHVASRSDPNAANFDPLRAAVLFSRSGNIEEAMWLVFLATHFGKHVQDGWELVRAVYGVLGGPDNWDWLNITARLKDFRPWLKANRSQLSIYHFSNHRKFESLSHTATVVESYVGWIQSFRSHAGLIQTAHAAVGQDPNLVFDHLYKGMGVVYRFGRLAKFDFLTMLDKLGLAPIQAGSAYLYDNATGPLQGARLLFTGAVNGSVAPRVLDGYLIELDACLQIGMQALEDSLCNWQKSPMTFESYRG